ncbi:hypothetical protein K8R51_36555 [Rhizobium favelukesii]|nr:hypothetical protein [Rhizobium favelukesii]
MNFTSPIKIPGSPELLDVIDLTPRDDLTPPRSSDRPVNLGPGDNIFTGTNGNDRILANGGNDWIFAGLGNDRVFGGGPVTTRSMATPRIRRLAVSAQRGMTIFSMAATATIALSPVTV